MSKATESVSIDSGSSYMKAYAGRGDPVMFPGVVREVFPGEDPARCIRVGARRWLVGEDVLRERSHDHAPDRSRWFHGGDEQHVQICHALARLGAKGKHETLVLSLPYQRANEAPFLEAVSKRKKFSWRDGEGDHDVEFNHIQVTPQGVGALLHRQESDAPPFESALMVDIGSCTTDIVAVRQESDGAWHFLHDACFSDQDVSTTLFFELLHREVNRIAGFAGKRFGYYDLMPRLMGSEPPTLSHRGEVISLEASVGRAQVEFTRRLKDVVKGYAGPTLWDELDQIILTGGGANCVNLDVWRDKRTHVLGPCANVLGQYSVTKE